MRDLTVKANTSSPTLNRVTFLPAYSIVPANTNPGMGLLGLLKPTNSPTRSPIGFQGEGCNVRPMQSLAVTAVAEILMSTSCVVAVGFATSRSCRTSVGPYFVQTMAFMRFSRLHRFITTLYGKTVAELQPVGRSSSSGGRLTHV